MRGKRERKGKERKGKRERERERERERDIREELRGSFAIHQKLTFVVDEMNV